MSYEDDWAAVPKPDMLIRMGKLTVPVYVDGPEGANGETRRNERGQYSLHMHSLTTDQDRSTLLHELIELICLMQGIEIPEQTVCALEMWLPAILRDTPELKALLDL